MVGDWWVGEPLGRGGMGEVFAVVHARFGHPAALKRVRLRREGDGDARDAFDEEIRAIARLDHPHVVRVFDRGTTPEGQRWFVMERALGSVGPPGSWDGLRAVLDEVLHGLAAAHGAGVLHLDIKPSNVLVRADGSHALADFGIALLADREARAVRYGSLPYMAPERFDGRPERLSPASDLYAVGCLAWELAQGSPPFAGADWALAAGLHAQAELPVLVPRVPVPAGFEVWASVLLAKRPGDRFGSAADARAALAALDRVGPSVARGTFAQRPASCTLTATAVGVVRPLDALLPVGPRPAPAPLPEAWPEPVRRAREGVGLGLLGLLALPFVGREAERKALWSALASVDVGFRAVALTGPPGAGRTRLGEQLVAAGVTWGGAHGIRIRGGEGSAVVQGLRRWAQLPAGVTGARAAEAVALRLGVPVADPRVAVDDLSDGGSARGVIPWIRHLGGLRRVIVHVDDALADAELAGWVAALIADRPPGVLLVCGVGDEDRAAHPDRAGWMSACDLTLPLGPLSEQDTRRLLADWVGLRPDLVAELASRCEGDVGLAVAMVVDGVRSGRLTPDARGLRGGAGLPWPDGVRQRWEERLEGVFEGVTSEVRAAILRGAALGSGLDTDRWVRTCGGQTDVVERAAARLAESGALGLTPMGWRWASPVAREVLLDGAADRAEHHAACAEVFDVHPDRWRRGVHLLRCGRTDEGLAELFHGAAEGIASGHMARAAWLLREAEQELVARGEPENSSLYGDLWYNESVLGPTHQGYARGWELLERMQAGAAANPDVEGWQRNGRYAVSHGLWLANVQYLPRRGAPLAAQIVDWLDAKVGPPGPFLENLGWHELTLGRSMAAIRRFEGAHEIGVRTGYWRLRLAANASLGVGMRHAGSPSAVEHLERAAVEAIEGGLLSARGDVYAALGDGLRFAGRLDEALAPYEEALRAEAEGEARSDPGFRMGLALLHRAAGRTELAERELRRCIGQLTDHGPSWEGGLALHLATVGAGVDVRAAIAKLRETGWIDPDLALSARILADRTPGGELADLVDAFASDQEDALARGKNS